MDARAHRLAHARARAAQHRVEQPEQRLPYRLARRQLQLAYERQHPVLGHKQRGLVAVARPRAAGRRAAGRRAARRGRERGVGAREERQDLVGSLEQVGLVPALGRRLQLQHEPPQPLVPPLARGGGAARLRGRQLNLLERVDVAAARRVLPALCRRAAAVLVGRPCLLRLQPPRLRGERGARSGWRPEASC